MPSLHQFPAWNPQRFILTKYLLSDTQRTMTVKTQKEDVIFFFLKKRSSQFRQSSRTVLGGSGAWAVSGRPVDT